MSGTILVPIDGTDNSERAVHKAIAIATQFDSRIILLYALAHTPSHVTGCSVNQETRRTAAWSLLSSSAVKVKAQNVEVETVLRSGRSVEQVVQLAKERNVDLIVMGDKRTGTGEKLFKRSVSESVTRNAPCPVLLISDSES